MPPFSSSQPIVLPIHGLATPFLSYLAVFAHFSSSQSIVLPIHGLATPSLGYLAVFVHFSSSQSIVLPINELAAPFLGYLAVFVHFSSSQSIVLAIHGLALTFYLVCGDWGQSMLALSAGGDLHTRKEAGTRPCLDLSYLLTILPATRPKVMISAMAFPPRRLAP